MASVPNQKALTVSDGATEYFNVDTVNKKIQIANGASLSLYPDNYVTQGLTFTASGSAPVVSGTAPAVANAGTIATAGVGVARVSPAGAVTGIILQAGTVNGQSCWIINEAAAANSVSFAASGTSNVADGTNEVIYGGQARHFIYDTATSLWYAAPPLTAGTLVTVPSATAAALANSGTIATAGLGVSRVTTSGNVTGAILAAGTLPGQEVTVINESANTITFAASSSNVADANTAAIPANCARKFTWNGTSWYRSA